jgi:hypothetical protein
MLVIKFKSENQNFKDLKLTFHLIESERTGSV